MAFQTGTSSSIENLMTQLSTFAQANGWTEDSFTAESATIGILQLSKNAVFAAFYWKEATENGVMGVGMNTSNDDTVEPWLSTGDDGQMYNNPNGSPTSINTRRCVNQFGGPHVAYWFFENDSNPAYIHVVVEVDTNRFRHFGFGEIEKIGDWAGGEYGYGHNWNQGVTVIDIPYSASHCYGLDAALSNQSAQAACMKIQGLQQAIDLGATWMICAGMHANPSSLDRAGNNKVNGMGGSRQGPVANAFSFYPISQLSAFKPLMPEPVFYITSTGTPDTVIFLGTTPDRRMVNMQNIAPGEILTVAGEQWYCFPWVVKKRELDDTEESWNAGTAYLREDA